MAIWQNFVSTYIHLSVAATALVGLCICAYIYFKKKPEAKKPMVCPIGGHCEDVVGSKYGKTFGIENTILGALYYLSIVVYAVLLYIQFPLPFGEQFILFMKVVTTSAFLFSIYLLSIMQFKLKMWCTWCIASAICSTIIFLGAVFLF